MRSLPTQSFHSRTAFLVPLELSRTYSELDIQRMYRKSCVAGAPESFHIHVDAKEAIPPRLAEELIAAGFVRDDFLALGAAAATMPNAASPISHMTWKGSCSEAIRRAWLRADQLLAEQGICAYLEGELVAHDAVLDDRLHEGFDEQAFNRLCPPLVAGTNPDLAVFACPMLSRDGTVVGSEPRLLPLYATKRRLEPSGEIVAGKTPRESGASDLFRLSEVHLTVRRNGLDARILALLVAMGLSDPIIPKLITKEDGTPFLAPSGKPLVIEDMPMTIQAATESSALIAFFDVVIKRILFEVGGLGANAIVGVERASIKFEPAKLFGLYNGRNEDGSIRQVFDPSLDLPQVLACVRDHNKAELDAKALRESWDSDTSSLGGDRIRVDSQVLRDKPADFWLQISRQNIWTRNWNVRHTSEARASRVVARQGDGAIADLDPSLKRGD